VVRSFKGNVIIVEKWVTWQMIVINLRGIKEKGRPTMNPGMTTVLERIGGIKEWHDGNLRSQSLVRRKRRQLKERNTIGALSVTTGRPLTTLLSIQVVGHHYKEMQTPISQPWILLSGVFRQSLNLILTGHGYLYSYKGISY